MRAKLYITTIAAAMLLFQCVCTNIKAETASSVYTLYNKTYTGTNCSAKSLEELEAEYDLTVNSNNNKEILYGISQPVISDVEKYLASTDINLYEIRYSINCVEEKLMSLSDEDVNNVLALVDTYQQLLSEEQEALNERNIYTNQYKYLKELPPLGSEDKAKEETLKEQIKEASNDLGDVLGVHAPLKGIYAVTSPFGYRLDPISLSSLSFHSGLDLRASSGTEVLSIFSGTVEKVTTTAGGGNTVWIDHGNDIKSVYMHLSKTLVAEGQKLGQYDVIALSGNTGSRTTGPHLHFGLYVGGSPVDPEKLFNKC